MGMKGRETHTHIHTQGNRERLKTRGNKMRKPQDTKVGGCMLRLWKKNIFC